MPRPSRALRIGAAILAAGASRRLGSPKQLLPFGGSTLLNTIARELCAASCDRVVVVLGANARSIAMTVHGLDVTHLNNAAWREGIASSIRCAATWAASETLDAVVLVACDQPRLSSAHVDRLIAAFTAEPGPIGSRYAGVVGVPAIFGARDFARLRDLTGDVGARALLGDAAVDWPDGAIDLDTAADVARFAAS